MPARHTRAVHMLRNTTAEPPRVYEAVTACEHALAFLMGGTYDPAEMQTGIWYVIEHGAPASAVPVPVTFDRSRGALPFEVGGTGERYGQLGDAMDAAVSATA
jgi:hypothetical protein